VLAVRQVFSKSTLFCRGFERSPDLSPLQAASLTFWRSSSTLCLSTLVKGLSRFSLLLSVYVSPYIHLAAGVGHCSWRTGRRASKA
jgi:hypothetical protein